ncbi:L-glutamine:2-deoxy-scyllo-inosose aminotransferase [Corynebacterium atrinae]|nr:aminotransferase class I/II-fold pyridoxal phosphate-dependent enzyme [Corynebacterium atrinae]WJY63005.1 L-glutamine:2-deoxy-scyllo-inosose aminotransferase [Corynebacterium atrinae]
MIRAGDVFAFGDHPRLLDLENWARTYFGVKFALAVSSGTAALHSAYVALGIRPGDEVLLPTYTFHATATPLLSLGAVPVLYDCEIDSTKPSIPHLESRIGPNTAAIVVSHMFGLVGDMSTVMQVASKRGIPVIEDAAQSHGAWTDIGKAGAIGTVGCFSLGGQKMITGGMGGLLLTNSRDIFYRALTLGHSHERAKEHLTDSSFQKYGGDVGGGLNLRMHPVAATLALSHAKTLDERIARRGRSLTRLSKGLQGVKGFYPPMQELGTSRGGWYGYKALYNDEELQCDSPSNAVKKMGTAGLKVSIPSTRPLHQTSLAELHPSLNPANEFPNAMHLTSRTIGFPDKHFHNVSDEVIDEYVLRAIHIFGEK